MTIKCQHCDEELPMEYRDSLDSTYVAHNYPEGIGQITDYYCDIDCVVEAHSPS